MTHWIIKSSLFVNYFVFAILLNSVGTVIFQVQNSYHVSETSASVLEAFKDISIAITSFFVASLLFRFGYKRSMLGAIVITGLVCVIMPWFPTFWMTKLLFAVTGIGFAIVKSSTMATIGLITHDQKAHASFMNFLESFFMVGVLCGYFLFGSYIDDSEPGNVSWLKVYIPLAILSFVALMLLSIANLDENKESVQTNDSSSFVSDFLLMCRLGAKSLVYVFLSCAFLYVLIEQSIMTWLPTFNSSILNLSASLSIQLASLLAASIAIGRFFAGLILTRVHWYAFLTTCLVFAGILVLLVLPLVDNGQKHEVAVSHLMDAPIAAFIFPLIGLVLAPVAPAINSVILSSLPRKNHTSMASLIVMFSALGGTCGSIITGTLFEVFDGKTAFYFSLVPLTLLLVMLYYFNQSIDKSSKIASN